MFHTGKLTIVATAIDPIVHGGGSDGNNQIIRKQVIRRTADGGEVAVPFVSGNSLKNRLRVNATMYALDAMGVPPGSLGKGEVDLLFSGGRLTSSGTAVALDRARRLQELFPVLSLLGYSAANGIVESKLACSALHLVCAENAFRIPDAVTSRDDVQALLGSGVHGHDSIVDEFGTRHDVASKAAGLRYLTAGDAAAEVERKGKLLDAAAGKGKKAGAEKARGDSAQMIYGYQAIMAGSVLWGTIRYAALTDHERSALASAFAHWTTDTIGGAPVVTVGAKAAVGYGQIRIEITGEVRVDLPRWEAGTALVREGDTEHAAYRAHLRDRRDEIIAAIHEAAA